MLALASADFAPARRRATSIAGMTTRTERQLLHEVEINAPVERVWELISDVRNAPQWSSQARKVFAFGPATKAGTFSVNLNHRGVIAWPTWAKVTDFQPGKRFANEVGMAGATWVFELEPGSGENTTILRQYRETYYPRGFIAGRVVTPAMGGEEPYNEFMDARVGESLEKIKNIVEAG